MRNRRESSRAVVMLFAPWVLLCAFVMSTALAHPLPQQPAPPAMHAGLDEAAVSRSAPEGRRDPFQSWLEPGDGGRAGPTLVCSDTPQPTPLERFDLSVLKMTGILRGALGHRAIISAPDNHNYFVTVGSAIGQQCGRVVAIQADRLVIAQQYQQEGHIVHKEFVLLLPHKHQQG